MRNIGRLVLLTLALCSSISHAETSVGEFLSIETPSNVNIILTGEAAENLYHTLTKIPAARQLPCGSAVSIRLDTLVCVNDAQGMVRCFIGIDKEAAKLVDGSACDESQPSIIGVGNVHNN